jgi:hypothetical protein
VVKCGGDDGVFGLLLAVSWSLPSCDWGFFFLSISFSCFSVLRRKWSGSFFRLRRRLSLSPAGFFLVLVFGSVCGPLLGLLTALVWVEA